MTGLSPEKDCLVEVAVVITNSELEVLDAGLDVVIKPRADSWENMSDFVRTMHTDSGLITEVENGLDLAEAEEVILDYIKQFVPNAKEAPLAGNSIGTDRMFINKYMPNLDAHLHYRNIDVSSIKELTRRWYPRAYFQLPKKDGGHRAFTDSAPVLEVELASRSGLGWRGKHTLTLSRDAGSMFFLGEIFVDRALPATEPASAHCGQCRACLDACPTQAIVAPYRLDARRCISYLTIEHAGPIPLEFRSLLGNRIYGCDDCQLACPWNKFAQLSQLPDFDARAPLTGRSLIELFGWSEEQFLRQTEGSPIRRIGHQRWRRNLAVALGNALRAAAGADLADPSVKAALLAALQASADDPSELVREHVAWALAQAKA